MNASATGRALGECYLAISSLDRDERKFVLGVLNEWLQAILRNELPETTNRAKADVEEQ